MIPPLPTAGDTLAAVEGALAVRRAADVELFVLAAHWADQHPAETLYGIPVGLPGRERVVMLGGEGTPQVAEFAAAELGVSLHQHPHAARNLIADALDVRHRFPGLWHLLTDELAVEVWVARKIAAGTRRLSQRQAAEIDDRLVEVAASLPPSRLLRVVEAMVLAADDQGADEVRQAALKGRFVTINQATEHGTKGLYAKLDAADAIRLDAEVDRLARILAARGDESTLDVRRSTALGWLANPAAALRLTAETEPPGLDTDLATALNTIDPQHLRPRVELVVHVTESDFIRDARGVARFEGGGRSGPITLAHAREVLGHAHVTIRPVIDLAGQLPADGYEFTGTLREAAFLATPVDCFPYAVSTSRTMQLDHTKPYHSHGPPGQTRLDNAGPRPNDTIGSPPTDDGARNSPCKASTLGAPPTAATESPTTPAPTRSKQPWAEASSTAPPPNNDSSPTCCRRSPALAWLSADVIRVEPHGLLPKVVEQRPPRR